MDAVPNHRALFGSGRGGLGEQSGYHLESIPRAVNSMLDEALRRSGIDPAATSSSAAHRDGHLADAAQRAARRAAGGRERARLPGARPEPAAPPGHPPCGSRSRWGRWATSRVSTSRGSCWRGCWTRRHSRSCSTGASPRVRVGEHRPRGVRQRCGRTCSAVTTRGSCGSTTSWHCRSSTRSSGRRRGRAFPVRLPQPGRAHRRAAGTPAQP